MGAGPRNENAVRVRGRRVYSNRDQRAAGTPLETLLHLVSLKVENRTASQRPTDEDLREVVSALYQVARGELKPEAIFALATRRACSMTGASGAALAIAEGTNYVCRSSVGESAPPVGAAFSATSGISGECVSTAQLLSCPDTERNGRVNADVCRALGIRSMVAVPVFERGQVRGVLEVFAGRAEAFQDRDLYLLQLISALIAHSLQTETQPPAETAAVRAAAAPPTPYEAEEPISATTPVEQPILALESWTGQPARSTFALSRSRILIGLAASAVLFAAVWASMLRSRESRPVRQSASDSAPEVSNTLTPPGQITAVLVEISGIEFKSHGEFTAVKVKLTHPVLTSSGRLQNPERIYFDLSNSDLGAALGGSKGTIIAVQDAYIARIRAVQAPGHSTRIVLDLKCACDYTAVAPDVAPYELSILVQPPHRTDLRDRPQSKSTFDGGPIVPARAPGTSVVASSGKLTIVIDPGHGGLDLGTTGPDGLTEKGLVLDIAHRLESMLTKQLGASVVLTRAGDRYVSLERRDQIANEARADLLISIHANSSSDPLTRGVETYYYATPNARSENRGPVLQPVSMKLQKLEAKRLASLVQRELYSVLSRKDQALRDRGVKRAQFALLVNAGVPAVLTEVAFMSSPSDERKLSRAEMRETIAKGLFEAISTFVNKQPLSAGL